MIKFYCEKCGVEMWHLASWEDIKSYTLEEIKDQLICSDCLLLGFKKYKEGDF